MSQAPQPRALLSVCNVLLIETARHPRFQIGASLLPAAARLGDVNAAKALQ
jgi:hypothetical protein